ncbi:MAG: glucosyl-3-phosphoglycerate synthase, partial [Acidimicrobiales bacterium]|nr:glucosyl-3-phosphoglycerate synthase [Acidimicrobiales bacterium]
RSTAPAAPERLTHASGVEMTPDATTPMRCYHHRDFDPADLAERKSGASVSVCLPARNEAATVGDIVATIRRDLIERVALIDEILVIDDHSTDDTGPVAERAGAQVARAQDVLPEYGEGHGKGEALWKSLHVATGDLIVWCDADIRDFESRFVVGLLGPLLTDPALAFVKGCYERPVTGELGGGRVTELVARPLLCLLFPHLASINQPLSGEYAGRREILEKLPFVQGYGVDIGLLIDVARLVGVDAIAQVDLGTRTHRNRSLEQLSPQAMAVLQTALRRAEVTEVPAVAWLSRPGQEPVEVDVRERPPLCEVPAYRPRSR